MRTSLSSKLLRVVVAGVSFRWVSEHPEGILLPPQPSMFESTSTHITTGFSFSPQLKEIWLRLLHRNVSLIGYSIPRIAAFRLAGPIQTPFSCPLYEWVMVGLVGFEPYYLPVMSWMLIPLKLKTRSGVRYWNRTSLGGFAIHYISTLPT